MQTKNDTYIDNLINNLDFKKHYKLNGDYTYCIHIENMRERKKTQQTNKSINRTKPTWFYHKICKFQNACNFHKL